MSEGFSIRRAVENDVAEIARIWKHGASVIFGTLIEDEEFETFFECKIKRQTDTFQLWVATGVEGEILGWQALFPMRNNPIAMPLYAESSTYISPHNKGNGLGKALLEYAINHAQRTGLHYVVGFIAENNTHSLRIVDALGWQRIGFIPPSPKSNSSSGRVIVAYIVPNLIP